MDEAPTLRNSSRWRLAVWGLRVMGPGLAVVVAGLITLLWSTGAGQAVLVVGMGVYLVGVVVTVVGIILVYREVPPPRPNVIWLRWTLLHDAVHIRLANSEPRTQGSGALGESDSDDFRLSAHWRLAVWGIRTMVPGLAVVVAGLVALLWSPVTGHAILAVGIGVYLVGIVFSFVEVRWAYHDLRPPRPEYARVRQTLLHDALHARS